MTINIIRTIIEAVVAITAIVSAFTALRQQRIKIEDRRLDIELTKAPNFYFTSTDNCERFNDGACGGGDFSPEVSEDCDGNPVFRFFNMVNCGTFPATNVKITVINKKEAEHFSEVPKDDTRVLTVPYWSGVSCAEQSFSSETRGEPIPIFANPKNLKIEKGDNKIYVAIEFQSDYSGTVYRRAYEWCIKDRYTAETKNKNSATQEKGEEYNEAEESAVEKCFERQIWFHSVRTIAASSQKRHWAGIDWIIRKRQAKKLGKEYPLTEWANALSKKSKKNA